MDNFLHVFEKQEFLVNQDQLNSFVKYKDLLVHWNEKVNLTAITEEKEIFYKHFLDSLLVLNISEIDLSKGKLIDVGSGAGFPGLPLAIVKEDLQVVLSDSLKKRIDFLDTLVSDLGINNVKLLNGRAEDLGKDISYRETFDFAVARAVSKLPVLLEYTVPFIKMGGLFIAYKGPDFKEELEASKNAMMELGVELLVIRNFTIEEYHSERNILVFKKTQLTPVKYPRKAGLPVKKPL